MKLLFDQNLSHRLAGAVADLFADSAHVRELGLARASDQVIWQYARDHDYTIISKDTDFRQRSFLLGAPPRIIWLNVGNCSTDAIETLIRTNVLRIIAFERDPEGSFLALSR